MTKSTTVKWSIAVVGPIPIVLIVRVICRPIYTTFVLGTALQNSGTRDNRFEHGPLDLHGKICSSFFSILISGTALLIL